jgi:hypothetical protein
MRTSTSRRFRSEPYSPLVLARIVGLLNLFGILAGAFDIGYVRSMLIVAGDPAATVQNILAHETMFRVGFTAHLLLVLANIPAEIAGFFLVRRVNVLVAAIAMACGLVGTSIEGLDLLNAIVPLKLAAESSALGAFNHEQLTAFSYTAIRLEDAGLLISFVFYGLDEFLSGYLIYRSRFLPRLIGVLLSIAGLCYFTQGITSFVAPALYNRLYPYILFPCLPGEASAALWLAIVGVNVAKWRSWRGGPRDSTEEPMPASL